ncbi:MAG: diphosphomevalonate decarboxylase [Myxococcales bacterium]|nr:diphosphomevalonate decarboxylase [Myxococcales bacterium]
MKGATATARAHANIALSKYWGKSDTTYNLPAVPSISITLAPLVTETRVRFVDGLGEDRLELDGQAARPRELQRAVELLDRVRAESGMTLRADIQSRNDFPTAAGLASSASGFCALAAAARAAAGLPFERPAISALARWSSASAARSAFGGYVELPAGAPGEAHLTAEPLFDPSHWELAIVVAVTAEGRKSVASTDGMGLTKRTSPYYDAWLAAAPGLNDEVRAGLASRDLQRLGRAMEQSTLAMHASAIAADPGLFYFQPATLEVWMAVRHLRDEHGISAFATADAGPHVKVLCRRSEAPEVERLLGEVPGVLRTLRALPGAGVHVVEGEEVT